MYSCFTRNIWKKFASGEYISVDSAHVIRLPYLPKYWGVENGRSLAQKLPNGI
ncbi:unnamed protein product [Photorhabdus laumondii subsp. laumondii TTO1]|uniref:Photorhabdus luminescens subsp. laumondii TTO1 complete genome segment 7/17 n=1 Tax=Photorhabdus laumondii subsp. laumondii (strain DSM 15139 / CIP 105565 / TT01) TaxID=243265 RepID=Q7N618_PHOLL|nr:unnamed protein product [Photorhabdus laumondii subsp. laumondii TTO1]